MIVLSAIGLLGCALIVLAVLSDWLDQRIAKGHMPVSWTTTATFRDYGPDAE